MISTYTKDDVDTFLRGRQKTLSVQSPFTLTAAGALSISLGDYASASTTQGSITATPPLKLSATNALTIEFGDYALSLSSALDAKAPKFTIAPPITLSADQVLGVDLAAYQTRFVVLPPLSMTDSMLSVGDSQLSVPTLIVDLSAPGSTASQPTRRA